MFYPRVICVRDLIIILYISCQASTMTSDRLRFQALLAFFSDGDGWSTFWEMLSELAGVPVVRTAASEAISAKGVSKIVYHRNLTPELHVSSVNFSRCVTSTPSLFIILPGESRVTSEARGVLWSSQGRSINRGTQRHVLRRCHLSVCVLGDCVGQCAEMTEFMVL